MINAVLDALARQTAQPSSPPGGDGPPAEPIRI